MSTLSLTFPLSRVGAGFGTVLGALAARWRYARRRAETRRYLTQMDEHMLQDIGVSRAQASFELDRALRWPAKE